MPQPHEIRIAFLVDDFNNEYSVGVAKGALQAARDIGVSVVFFGVGSLGNPVLYYGMRNNLLSVLEPEDFNGIIYHGSSLSNYIGAKKFLKYIEKYRSIPSAFLSIHAEGRKCFGIDNRSGMYEMVDHMIRVHNRKKIAFIGGTPGVDDADDRREAYKKALNDNNIEFDSRYVYDGDFSRQAGILGVEYFFDDRNLEFDALIGANDFMALYAMKELQRRGFKIPEDISIGGFDDLASARSHSPQLTTVHQPVTELGYTGTFEFAKDLINNESRLIHTVLPTKTVFRESCGCKRNEQSSTDNLYCGTPLTLPPEMSISEREELDSILHVSTRNMIGSFDESDIRDVLDESFRMFGIDDFSIAVYEDDKNSRIFYDTKKRRGETFPSRHLLPERLDSLPSPFYKFVMPLFHREEDIGFFVSDAGSLHPHVHEVLRDHISGAIKGSRLLKEARDYSKILEEKIEERTSELAQRSEELENALKEVKKAGKKLEQMAIVDELTGLYNRRGFMTVAKQNLELMKRKKTDILLVFLDLDGLKQINDTFGHSAGDKAIKSLGEILVKVFRKSDIIARLGGDEFTILAIDCTIKKYDNLIKRMNLLIKEFNESKQNQFILSVSCGAAPKKSFDYRDYRSLEELMDEADNELYRVKKEKKEKTDI